MLHALVVGLACLSIPFVPAPIVGGQDADQPYVFMVSLQDPNGEHFCGGVLVKPEWVLTAAHCVQNNPPSDLKARVGSNERNRGGELSPVTKVIVHSGFDGVRPGNDIALVKLALPAHVAPIQVARSAPAGTTARLLGWGQTCPRLGSCGAPLMLQQLDTKVLEATSCLDIDGLLELCTESPGGTSGACYGDSGGPEIVPAEGGWQLVGVTSRAGNDSPDCGTGPSIYTNATVYPDWISQQTG